MVIEMSVREFQELRRIIQQFQHSEVTKVFNDIFSNSGDIKSIMNPISGKVEISIPEEKVEATEAILAIHAKDAGRMLKDEKFSVLSINKWIKFFKALWHDLQIKLR